MDYATALASVMKAANNSETPITLNEAKKLAKLKVDRERRARRLAHMTGSEYHTNPATRGPNALANSDPTGDQAASQVDRRRLSERNDKNARRRIATRDN